MSASFDLYKIFYYVSKYGNITHAANALFLSQSTVSRSVQSLEAELGCRLFERFQHGVTLTAEGELLFSHVSAATEQLLLGEERVKQLHSSEEHSIRLGVDNFVFTEFILPVMADFRKDFPSVKIEISSAAVSSHSRCIEALKNEETDAIFALGPLPDTPGITSQNLGEYTDVFVGGKNLSDRVGRKVRLYDIALNNFAALNKGISGSDYLRTAFAMHGLHVEPGYLVEDFHHLVRLVEMDLCLALIPAPLFRRLEPNGKLFSISHNSAMPKRSINILSSRSSLQNIARDELIRRIKKNIRSALSDSV